ncbi:PAS domain S-box protein [Halorubrum ezzemoulense]|uniref:PAS domain S-box protein n=1 Tax=Halorubrum ezzemoulense TaxID=337243 RepID=UPI00232A9C44|nr:PAS domain S-box protein [Halorubrum ezzemoulense]MDB2225993.1 PAS domain S-box protein [Halorubrum ezzemoulense]MDB2276279.1 PAS domain S-box protein [Halorubrum ezzemoulense]
MRLSARQEIQILHVDDEPSITDLTATFLEREDDQFSVETATSADEGLQHLGDRPPDCIVSDYNMPSMDGLEFLQAVREDYPDLPFILFTGKGSEEVASDAISADVTDYLQKKSGTEQYELLANRIRNAVDARRETKRADRQEKLMRLTEFAGDTGGFELDMESETLLLTDGTRRLAGVPEDAHLNLEEAIELYHPNDQPDVRETINRTLEAGEQTRDTWRLQTRDNDERLVDVIMTPATDGDDVTTIRGAIHDITERKERERELRAERQFIEQALDTLDDLFYVLNPDGTLRRWNDRVPEITGYSDEELADMDAIDLFLDGDRETIAGAIETTLADGEATVEADLRTADGERLPYEFAGAQLTDEDGTVTGLVGVGRDLTERRQRERRFQALVEESNDVISIVDTEGVFQYQSPSIERILGYDPTETIGDTAWEYVHPDDRADLIEAFERGVADPDANPLMEYRARHADGSWRWFEARGNNQLDNPAVEGYIINSRDVTEKKEREQELSLFFEESPLGAIQWGEEFQFERMNDRAEEILGYSETELHGEPWERIVADDDRERVGDAVESLLDADGGRRVINDNVRKDGETLTCEWHNRAVTDADGTVESVFSKFQDVTERERRKRELQEYETVIEGLSDAVYVVDEDGRFRYVNDEFTELVGYDTETIIGNTPSLIKDGNSVERAEHHLGRLLSSNGPETVTFEVTIQPRTGDPIVCEDHMCVLPYDGEEFDGSVGVLRDITEHKQYEQELEAQNERLEEFASIVSHDLRNPLGVAEGHIKLAEGGDENGHPAKALDAIARSQALIDDLLTLAREGDQVDEVEAVDLGELAKKSWQSTETAQATLNVDESELIEADRDRLREIFENLYRNAVEHGGDDVTVHVGAMEDGFCVADTGSGIPESARDEIFEAGYSTADDGTGFGLRIVEQIAKAHGWEVSVTESTEGGARFEITGIRKLSD